MSLDVFKKYNKYIRWIPFILVYIFTFMMSHIPAVESSQLSGTISDGIIKIFLDQFNISDVIVGNIEYMVRKFAHVFEYCLLALTFSYAYYWGVKAERKRPKYELVTLLFCIICAISDEVHQLSIPGRSGEVKDVLIDGIGIVLGIVIYTCGVKITTAIDKKRSIIELKNAGNSYIWTFYLFAILMVMPFYYRNTYIDIGEAKYIFVAVMSAICIIATVTINLSYYLFTPGNVGMEGKRLKVSVTDTFVLIYLISTFISYMMTSYKEQALLGCDGWHMGLLTQIVFCAIYFAFSRYLVKVKREYIYAVIGVANIIAILAVLNRFHIDPLQMYANLPPQALNFLSTIGNPNWYSSYLTILLTIIVALYIFTEEYLKKSLERCGLFLSIIILSASLVTQKTDSGFIAILGIYILALFYAVEKKQYIIKVIKVAAIMSGTFIAIGFLRDIFKDNAVPLDGLSEYMMHGILIKITFVISIIMIAIICTKSKWKKECRAKISTKWVRVYIVAAVISVVVTTLLLVVLNTRGMLTNVIFGLEDVTYFNFNDDWGNGRGRIWRLCWKVFSEYDIELKLFGCGPDMFSAYVYENYYYEVAERWAKVILTNTHNEWFNAIINYGLIGGLAYIGIFLSLWVRLLAGILKNKYCKILKIVVSMAIICYILHNFFCFQQIVCTPIIFILLGCGEAAIRNRIKLED